MTEMNKDGAQSKTKLEARIKRRSVLKAGAVIAPLAVTLHSGIPMAHAASAGLCIENMKTHIEIPTFDNQGNPTGNTEQFNPSQSAYTNRTFNVNGLDVNETHWDYVMNEQLSGASCLQSFDNAGLIRPI